MASIEREVEYKFISDLEKNGVYCIDKNKDINDDIKSALENAVSKQGGDGGNRPDIQFLIEIEKVFKKLPVVIEAKGTKGKLVQKTEDGDIELVTKWTSDSQKEAKHLHKIGDISNYSTINNFAVNGAVHYARAIISGTKTWKECIAVGINGFDDDLGRHYEQAIYYISEDNFLTPIFISNEKELLYRRNWNKLFELIKNKRLTDEEKEKIRFNTEKKLEEKVKKIHQSLYENKRLKTTLGTNEKLYLFCGFIMAGLKTTMVAPLEENDFKGNVSLDKNDGTVIVDQIRVFLKEKNCSQEKIDMISDLLDGVFKKKALWEPVNGESIIKALFRQVHNEIIPCFEENLHLDFTGKILNSLNDWVSIEDDKRNDVVLTPRYVTKLMAQLARTNRNSFVWDKAMGSAGFLVSAMDIMIEDAKNNIIDVKELEEKIEHIKEKQLLGIEILGNIYILAVLNMILMGDGSSNIFNGDSHNKEFTLKNLSRDNEFPANVFLLNPPYSAPGKGFNFVEEALNQMASGYACILIQESAGNGQGLPYTKRILKNNTLKASIKMPKDLFGNKASVSVCIFLFEIGVPHTEKKKVKFIDFSDDGYDRQNRKKSTQEVNLKNKRNAEERYKEIVDICLDNRTETKYYTKENGKFIEDTISLNGDDWLFNQHQKINITPTEKDFKKIVGNYLAWRVANVLRNC